MPVSKSAVRTMTPKSRKWPKMTSAPPKNPGRDRPPLTRDRVLKTALALVDEHGLEALTMRRLGQALGVEAMSLYNHVPNKAALLEGVVEELVGQIEIPPIRQHWTERLKTLGRSYRTVALDHPKVVPLLAMRPLSATPALRPVEAIFVALEEAGFPKQHAADAYRVMAAFAIGYTMMEAAELSRDAEAGGLGIEQTDALHQYPHLMAAAPYLLESDADNQFEFGLEILTQGLVAARHSSTAAHG